MNEEYIQKVFQSLGLDGSLYDAFKNDISTNEEYNKKVFNSIGLDGSLYDSFKNDTGLTAFEKKNLVDGTSPMEPMDSTLPQEGTGGLSESEELLETEFDVADQFEGMPLFKKTPDYLIDKDKQKELADLENKKFVENIDAQSNKIAESYADELDNEFYAQEEVVKLINEANRKSKNEVQAFVDTLVSSGIDPTTDKSKKQIQDYYSLIFDKELSSDEKFDSLVSSYSDVRADKVFNRVKQYQSSASKAKKAKDLMDNPIYETLSKIPVAKNLLDGFLLSDGLVGEASSAFMYGKPASKELVPVAEASAELKKDRARLAKMDVDGVDEVVEYLPSSGTGAPPSKIKFTRKQVLDRIQSRSDEISSLSPEKINRALDLQKISQFLSPKDQFLEGDFTLQSLGGLVGQQLANQVEVPILGTYALELGASYLDTVKEIAEYKYGEASPENIIKVIDSGEDGAAELSAAAQLSATIDAFGLVPIGKGVSIAVKGAIKSGSKTASKTASETFKKNIIGRVKKQIKENIKDKIKNKAARKFIGDSYQVVKGSLIGGLSEFPTETTQSLLVSEAGRKTIEEATGQELETDIEGALKEGGTGLIVASLIPFTAGSLSIAARVTRDVYKSSKKSLAEKARRKIQEKSELKSKDYLVNESPKTRVEINEIIENANTPEDLDGISINNDKGIEDKLVAKAKELQNAVQEQETREVPDAEQAEGVQEVEIRREQELEPIRTALAMSEQTGEIAVVNGEPVTKQTLNNINAKYDAELKALEESTQPTEVEGEVREPDVEESVASPEVIVEDAPDGTFLNIEMVAGKDGREMTQREILDAFPMEPLNVELSGKTLVIQVPRELSGSEMIKLAKDTNQDAIPQLSNKKGVLHAQSQEKMNLYEGKFVPNLFIEPKKIIKDERPKAGNRLFNEPLKAVKAIADRYYKREFKGKRQEFKGVIKINKEFAKRISDAFDAMQENPNDPKVKAAYEALAKETMDQYQEFKDAGYTIEIDNSEPYKNSQEMIDDLRKNKRMKIFSTESGFGDTPITDKQRAENPLLRGSGVKDVNGNPLLINDVFRAIHDFYGHAELGNSFGPLGEENAWNVHARMFSPLARRAMTTETRGQNSYVNFSGINDEAFKLRDQARKLREEGKEAEADALTDQVYEMMKFADQKVGLLPEEFSSLQESDIDQKTTSEVSISDKQKDNVSKDFEVFTTKNNISLSRGFKGVARNIGSLRSLRLKDVKIPFKKDPVNLVIGNPDVGISIGELMTYYKRSLLSAKKFFSKDLFKGKELKEAKIAKNINIVEQNVAKLNRAIRKNKLDSEKQIQQLDLFLRGLPNTLNEKIIPIATEMRQHIDSLSQILIDNGWVADTKEYVVEKVSKDKGEYFVIDTGTGSRIKLSPAQVKQIEVDGKAPAEGETVTISSAVNNNLGNYLTRSYKIFDDSNWKDKVEDVIVQRAKNLYRQQLRPVAERLQLKNAKEQIRERLLPQYTNNDGTVNELELNKQVENEYSDMDGQQIGNEIESILEQMVDNKIDEVLKSDDVKGFLKKGKLGSKDLSILKERKDIPLEIRMLMGEYTDPIQNYARTILKQSSLVANQRFLESAKKMGMGNFFFEADQPRPRGFDFQIAAEGSETMAPLNGLYTTKEMYEQFQDASDSLPVYFEIYMKAISGVKWAKTIGSVTTHLKNFFGNLAFMAANGHWRVGEMNKAFAIIKNDISSKSNEELNKMMNEYIDLTIVKQSTGLNEIRDMFKDANFDEAMYQRLSKQPTHMGKAKRLGLKAKKFLEDVYGGTDDLFKIVAYENEMSRYSQALYGKDKSSLTEAERGELSSYVAEIVKNTYPTYSRVPEAIQLIRRFPLLGNFVSFQAESWRTAYNTLNIAKNEMKSDNPKVRKIGMERIIGITSYLAIKDTLISYFSVQAGMGLSGIIGSLIDDDEEKEKQNALKKYVAPWNKNSEKIMLEAKEGEIKYIDVSSSDPYGGIAEVFNALASGDDLEEKAVEGFLASIEPFTGVDITTNTLSQIIYNDNGYGGRIYNPEDPNRLSKKLIYAIKKLEPGTISSMRRLGDSENLTQEITAQLLGLRTYDSNLSDSFGFKFIGKDGYRERLRNAKSLFNQKYDKDATLEEIVEGKKVSDNAVQDVYIDIYDDLSAAVRLGAPVPELIKKMKSLGLSNKDIKIVLLAGSMKGDD